MGPLLSNFGLILLLAASVLSRDDAEDLLRRSDVAAFIPKSFRARLVLKRPPSTERHEVEMWRSGEKKTLIRFLDRRDRGKFLLRLGDQLWFLAPAARKPVRLNPSYRLYGGITVDEVLGVQLSEAYQVNGVSEETDSGGKLVALELRAKTAGLMFPQVRYVVRSRTARPLSALYRLQSGKVATSVEFLDWNETGRVYARRILIRDLLRKGEQTEVEVVELDERPVPDSLFDLSDPSSRLALEPR